MKELHRRLICFFAFALTLSGCVLRPMDATTLHPGNHHLGITVDDLERTFILHVPIAVRKSEALPLLIVLHGSYGTGRKMQLGLGFDSYADERGFYVAYPDAYQEPGSRQTARWNDGRDTLESSDLGIDDLAFILAMIENIGSHVPLDEAHIYATGASNGGMMTYRLGCEASGTFAGIAPVIGNIPLPIVAPCSPSGPLSFLAINGDADPFVPFDGGEVCEDVKRGCDRDDCGLFRSAEVAAQPAVLGSGWESHFANYRGLRATTARAAETARRHAMAARTQKEKMLAGGNCSGLAASVGRVGLEHRESPYRDHASRLLGLDTPLSCASGLLDRRRLSSHE